jgi:hypothetical protein
MLASNLDFPTPSQPPHCGTFSLTKICFPLELIPMWKNIVKFFHAKLNVTMTSEFKKNEDIEEMEQALAIIK